MDKVVKTIERMKREGKSASEIRSYYDEMLLKDLENGLQRVSNFTENIKSTPFYLLDLVLYIPLRIIEAIGDAIRSARGR